MARFLPHLTTDAISRNRFPDYIWQSLSTFAFACYIAPNNQKVNTVFGVSFTVYNRYRRPPSKPSLKLNRPCR